MPDEATLSIIVPVHDEITMLRRTAPLLLRGLPVGAELLYVCNGCTDASAAFLHSLVDARIRVIELPDAGKAKAMRAGETHVSAFPRFFVDADVAIAGFDIARLALALDEDCELVSPRLIFEEDGLGWVARSTLATFKALPHARNGLFQMVIGVSAAGRARWGEMPDLMADDSFMVMQVQPRRRRILAEVNARARSPRTIADLIGTRARIARSLTQLRKAGVSRPRARGQRRALMVRLLTPRHAPTAAIYVGVVLAASILARLQYRNVNDWYCDRSSRREVAGPLPVSADTGPIY